VQEYILNVAGSEWVIIIFVVLIVLLGTNKLPDVAKKLGKVVGEYNKTKNTVQNEFKNFSSDNLKVNGPVQNEREKLERIAKSLEINFENKTDDELRDIISFKIGQEKTNTTGKNNQK